MNGLRRLLVRLPLFAIFFIAACASGIRDTDSFDQNIQVWQGRIGVKVRGENAQSFSAQFTLRGSPSNGSLSLYTPLGSTVAQIQWSPDGALLLGQGAPRHFDTLEGLTLSLTGAELPITGLFAWLEGSTVEATGWQIDRADLQNGLLLAHRDSASASIELKVLLDR